jgi:hypothetical protein
MFKKLILLIFIFYTSVSYAKYGVLHDVYISKEDTLDTDLVCRCILPQMTPEQINESIKDIRLFIEEYERAAVNMMLANKGKIGEFFLTNILHAYGHVITFIETSWVDLKTKKNFIPEDRDMVDNAAPLEEFFEEMKRSKGIKLQIDKFYASCIDYLIVMIGTNLSTPCPDAEHLEEVEDRWIFWLEKVARKIERNEIFGGYYNKYVKTIREVFFLWKSDFEKEEEIKRKLDWGNDDDSDKEEEDKDEEQ